MAAKDMYVRECMTAGEPEADEPATTKPGAGTKKSSAGGRSKSEKETVELGKATGKSLAQKKKEKGCC